MMHTENNPFDQILKIKKEIEEERNRLPYNDFFLNFRELINSDNFLIKDEISKPVPNSDGKYICIKEPSDFIDLFKSISDDQEKCKALFKELLNKKSNKIIREIIDDYNRNENYWFNSSKNGIYIRPGLISSENGYDKTRPDGILFGDDCVHGMIVGSTGSGKSVFINNIIFSLISEYSPWELKLYLADFKKVELSRYLQSVKTPHVQVVAATSEDRYVVSMFESLNKNMKDRQDLLMLLGLKNLKELRDEYGIVLPRILVLVDEFQQLFTEATVKERDRVDTLLLQITKLGRATGFHLLFASQEMSNTISSNAFANFKAAFALRCDASVSSSVLGNSAAANVETGTVIVNTSQSKREEYNVYYKVPFIDSDNNYFVEFLNRINELNQKTIREMKNDIFDSKFYQEDYSPKEELLHSCLEKTKEVRNGLIKQSDDIVDIFVTGESVLFNYKKFDYETVFLERGVSKNIGVFSPKTADLAYIIWLLTQNILNSPKKDIYQHHVLIRNETIVKMYDFIQKLNISEKNVKWSDTYMLEDICDEYDLRREIISYVNKYNDDSGLYKFVNEELLDNLFEEDEFDIEGIDKMFRNKNLEDIPNLISELNNEYHFLAEEKPEFIQILEKLYDKKVKGTYERDLFMPIIFWILGSDLINSNEENNYLLRKFNNEILNDSLNYNMLFILFSSSVYEDFRDHYRCCEYVFINGNNEDAYTKLFIPATKKSEENSVFDFVYTTTGTMKPFKMFRTSDIKEVVEKKIDFDEFL